MSDAALLAAYRATTWTVQTPRGGLRVRLDDAPLPIGTVGIITACNPASALRPESENQAANQRLRSELRAARAEVWPALAHGTGPEADHWREPGFAVARLPLDTLIAFGVRYGQNAIVWVDSGGRPLLVVTRPGFGGRAVGDHL